ERLTLAGGRPRRDGRASGSAHDAQVDFDRRIAARVQNLTAVHPRDFQSASKNVTTEVTENKPRAPIDLWFEPCPPFAAVSAVVELLSTTASAVCLGFEPQRVFA